MAHEIAIEQDVVIWVRRPDGTKVQETVRVLPGWLLAPAAWGRP